MAARGLASASSIVERIGRVLDHPVALRSAAGRGSAFTVDLPVAVAAARRAFRTGAAAAHRRPLDGLNVLAIDNEPAILDGMETLLSGWGFHVIKAADVPGRWRRCMPAKLQPDFVWWTTISTPATASRR